MRPLIGILGSYPPPFGGTATHVLRLSALLERRGLEHVVYNAVSKTESSPNVVSVADHRHAWMLKYALTSRERLVYICSARLEVWLLGAFMAARRGKQVIVRLRNVALIDYLKSPRTRTLASWALRHASYVVAVSDELADAARSAGVREERIIQQPGFLPPEPVKSGSDGMSPEQREIVARCHPLITANGKIDFYRGVDLYGLDHLVELIGRLKPSYPKIGLVIAFWDHLPQDEPRLRELKARAAELGVAQNILFHTAPWQFVPVLGRSDLFIRPTVTDGDANSVREALYLGVPAIASDVVSRPKGTIVCRSRDLEELVAKASEALRAPPPRIDPNEVLDLDRVERYIDTLERLATG